MPNVRKENSKSLEYVCPECGETFDEGAAECAGCGIEFDWSEEMEYLCPQCGTVVDPDQARCPGCAAEFSMDGNGEYTIEYEPEAPPASEEDMLDAAIDEALVRPNGTSGTQRQTCRRHGQTLSAKALDCTAGGDVPHHRLAGPHSGDQFTPIRSDGDRVDGRPIGVEVSAA